MRRLLAWMDDKSGRPTFVPVWYWRSHQVVFVLVAIAALVPYWFTSEPFGPYGRVVYIAFPLSFYCLSYAAMRMIWQPQVRHASAKRSDDPENKNTE